MTNSMALELKFGLIMQSMKVSTLKGENMGKESLISLMGLNMKVKHLNFVLFMLG
jgi:hypothetical protein